MTKIDADDIIASPVPGAPEKVKLETTCPFCGKKNTAVVPKAEWEQGLLRYKSGALIQNAFPTFSPSVRELLVTGICDKCWDSTFG